MAELTHADVFADFLDMAEYLLQQGYKDPAAVLAGGVLEEHLRKLCTKNGIDTFRINPRGDAEPKKAEALNAEPAGARAYNKLEQKKVTSWLDLRNKAAHGQYGQYDERQVELFLLSLNDFLTRHPT